jgi:hypothetical protein
LKAQPEQQPNKSKANHSPVEAVADGQQHGAEGPFNELGGGVDDVLRIHGRDA